MPTRAIGFILIVSTLGFVTVGDIFLPRPFNTYSRNTRQQIDRLIITVMPKPTPERPSKKREGQMDKFLHRAQPSTAPNKN
jgi:hypothetical protein